MVLLIKKHKDLCSKVLIDDGNVKRFFLPFAKSNKRWKYRQGAKERTYRRTDIKFNLNGDKLIFSTNEGHWYTLKNQRLSTSEEQKAREKIQELIQKSNPELKDLSYSGKLVSQICGFMFNGYNENLEDE